MKFWLYGYSAAFLAFMALWTPPADAGVGAWSPLGPTGGNIHHLIHDPSDPAVLYASAETGLFRSEDRGASWTEVTELSGVLLVNPSDSQILYLGTATDGVQKSTDRGSTWQSRNTGLADLRLTTLVSDPTTPDILFAGTRGGLFKSTDGALSWAPLPLATAIDDVTVRVDDPQVVYAVTDDQIHRSTDGGGTWSPLNLLDAPVGFPTCIVSDPQNPTTLYTCTTFRVGRSVDGGDTWTALPDFTMNPFSRTIFTIRLDPARTGVLLIETMDGPFSSIDGGATWTPVSHPVKPPPSFPGRATARTFLFDPTTLDAVFVGNERGVFFSQDLGQSWSPSSEGMRATKVRSLAVQPGPGQGICTQLSCSLDGGSSWMDVYFELLEIEFGPTLPSKGYGSGSSGVLRSLDLFSTAEVLPVLGFGGAPQQIAIDRSNPDTLYIMQEYGVSKSIDGGDTWTASNTGWPFSLFNNLPDAKAFHVTRLQPEVLFMAVQDIRFARAHVLRSLDGGLQWQDLPVPFESLLAHDLVLHPGIGSTVFVATSGGLYRSLDMGVTWTLLDPLPGGSAIHSLAIEATEPFRLYAGVADGEVFVSPDDGESWQSLGAPAPGFTVSTLEVAPDDPETLYAGTDGRSAFALTQTNTVALEIPTLSHGSLGLLTLLLTWMAIRKLRP